MLYKFKKGSLASEERNICIVYENKILNIRKWFIQFQLKYLSFKGSFHSEQQILINKQMLITVIEENPKLTTQEMAQQINIIHMIFINHFYEFGKVSKLGK